MYHLTNIARERPDKLALLFEPSGHRLTFQELERLANRAANALLALGLRKGDCVAFCIENSANLIAATLGAQRIGLYYVLVSTKLSRGDLDYILADSVAKLLVLSVHTEAAQYSKVHSVPAVPTLSIGYPEWSRESWEERVHAAPESLPEFTSPGREMIYTSGTTGRPKGVRKPAFTGAFDQVDSRNASTARASDLGLDSVFLSTSPLYHAAPNRYLSAAIHYGASSVVMEHFDGAAALALIERHQVTHSLWVPTMFHRMLRLPDAVREHHRLKSLKYAVHGAAPCPVHVKQAMIDWWGPVLYEYYSGTEGIGATGITSEEWLAHKGSVGRAKDGTLHILDEAHREVPHGTVGKVYFESDARFEYWNDPEKTRSICSPQGWRSFGDVGYVDEEGYLYLTDRADFTINSGGVKIYPQEIENLLLADVRVADAAVFGLPHAEFGEEVTAVVQPVDPAATGLELEAALKRYCREQLGPIKVPRRIYFEIDFPRHATGKLYKKALRDRYLAAMQSVEGN